MKYAFIYLYLVNVGLHQLLRRDYILTVLIPSQHFDQALLFLFSQEPFQVTVCAETLLIMDMVCFTTTHAEGVVLVQST